MRVMALAGLGVLLLLGACASSEWARVQAEDSPSAYRRFLRDHPDSEFAAKARERLDYLQLRQHPDLDAFDRFVSAYPQSPYLDELRRLVEEPAFEEALRSGTASAFRRFLERFADGPFAARAQGNLAYLEIGGPLTPPQALAEFLERHPESDYAEEARRTLNALALRDRAPIRVVGLRIEIDPSTPGTERLLTRFREQATAAYGAAGQRLVLVPPGAPPPDVDAWLTIRHGERTVGTEVSDGQVTGPGLLATTEVTLRTADANEPFWSETFILRASQHERRAGSSVLFSERATGEYWPRFFVPVAHWPTYAASRPPLNLPAEAVAVDLAPGIAATLLADGRVQVLNVIDPARPQVLAEYEHARRLQRFDGIRLVGGSHLVLFGSDGLAVLAFEDSGIAPLHDFDRTEVGSVVAVEAIGDRLLVAGSRGLLEIPLAGGAIQPLLGKGVRDLAREGNWLALVDEEWLLLAPVEELVAGGTAVPFRLGRGLEAWGVRLGGGIGCILSPHGVLTLDLSNRAQPAKLAWVRTADIGLVRDAALLDGRLFLLGDRGLQVLDPRSGRVLDSVDVAPRARLAQVGRQLVTVGAQALQVVDLSPWTAGSALAAPTPAAP